MGLLDIRPCSSVVEQYPEKVCVVCAIQTKATIFQYYTSKYNILSANYNNLMSKKIGLFWLRDDFRVTKNHGLAEATKNHDQVVVFYLYKKLNGYNISLEILKTESFKSFFNKLVKKKGYF